MFKMLLLAGPLALLLILPPDALRFELMRAARSETHSAARLLRWRLLGTLPIFLAVSLGIWTWAENGPLGVPLIVFTGALTAATLWMLFWIRTFIADPFHPLRPIGFVSVTLASWLSFPLWLSAFTQLALMIAWVSEVRPVVLITGSLVWVLVDAFMVVAGGESGLGQRFIEMEAAQRRVGRWLGSLLLVLGIWAVILSIG